MRNALRTLGALITLLGVAAALWGPLAFEAITGQELPVPGANDPAAMAVWSGVAFFRLVGAGLVLAGALLYVGSATRSSEKALHHAVFWSAAFGVWIAWSQQKAIWSGSAGWLFVAVFGVLVVISGLGLARSGLHRGKPARPRDPHSPSTSAT